VPVEGTFSYHSRHTDDLPEIRGAVHAVRRVPGGTAVYYSLGVPAGQRWSPSGAMSSVALTEDYAVGEAFEVGLVDTVGLGYYQPMVGEQGCLCPKLADLGGDSGQLHVGWALVPPLPEDVTTVSVLIAFGVQVEDVPVGEGPLEPAVDEPSTIVGEGWPALPDQAAIATVADPARYVRPLVRNSTDLTAGVTTAESPEQVAESLNADVLFAVDSATLGAPARATLSELAGRLRERAQGEVSVVGHTDDSGDPAYNQGLSQARAEAVKAALDAELGGAVPLTASGRGEQEPVADNATEDGRALNRRVTITYQVTGPS